MNKFRFVAHVLCAILAFGIGNAQEKNTPSKENGGNPSAMQTETVIATYNVIPGTEDQFWKVFQSHWTTCRRLNLVLQKPHMILRGKDDFGKAFFVEILTWKNPDAPDHAPAEVRSIWKQLNTMTEPRDGHPKIYYPEVEVLVGGK
ncbi:MAG: hypothetical protein HY033_01180 [Ignavibacteriae bacterium]|nr:hypothetical protein [Ignavibacteria bacterium]MBI3363502.1 hypothetical protein [Ignavibacteriota bacterium]